MALRSKSDISNSAIRIFLQNVGKFYDEARGYEVFKPTKSQKEELLDFFEHECCYCGVEIDSKTLSQDHLIPTNKEYLGLHAWGNVVPCCQSCNNKKQQRSWQEFLDSQDLSNAVKQTKIKRITDFVDLKKYDPNLGLHDYAGNLYEDVGTVAMTLINNRYKHATDAIERIIEKVEE